MLDWEIDRKVELTTRNFAYFDEAVGAAPSFIRSLVALMISSTAGGPNIG